MKCVIYQLPHGSSTISLRSMWQFIIYNRQRKFSRTSIRIMAHSKKKTDEAEYNSNLSPKQYSILVFQLMVFYTRCKQELLLLKKIKIKIKKIKKIERNVAFYLHIKYTKRGYKIQKKKKRKKQKEEKKARKENYILFVSSR